MMVARNGQLSTLTVEVRKPCRSATRMRRNCVGSCHDDKRWSHTTIRFYQTVDSDKADLCWTGGTQTMPPRRKKGGLTTLQHLSGSWASPIPPLRPLRPLTAPSSLKKEMGLRVILCRPWYSWNSSSWARPLGVGAVVTDPCSKNFFRTWSRTLGSNATSMANRCRTACRKSQERVRRKPPSWWPTLHSTGPGDTVFETRLVFHRVQHVVAANGTTWERVDLQRRRRHLFAPSGRPLGPRSARTGSRWPEPRASPSGCSPAEHKLTKF
jgi:hypothetical protein